MDSNISYLGLNWGYSGKFDSSIVEFFWFKVIDLRVRVLGLFVGEVWLIGLFFKSEF